MPRHPGRRALSGFLEPARGYPRLAAARAPRARGASETLLSPPRGTATCTLLESTLLQTETCFLLQGQATTQDGQPVSLKSSSNFTLYGFVKFIFRNGKIKIPKTFNL